MSRVMRRPSRTSTTASQPAQNDLMAPIADGEVAELDPANAYTGREPIDEPATIASARFKGVDFRKKDGTYPVDANGKRYDPQLFLEVVYQRQVAEGSESSGLLTKSYRYGLLRMFGTDPTGKFPRVQPSSIKPGSNWRPRPSEKSEAMILLRSIQNAGLSDISDRMKKQGTDALVGLDVHIREQEVEGQDKRMVLVDHIEGGNKAAPSSSSSAPVQDNSEIETAAEEAVLEALTAAKDNTLNKKIVPTTVFNLENWKTHPLKGSILSLLRKDNFAFLTREDAPWTVDGMNIKLEAE